MEIILTNVIYLVLVGGVLLAAMALFTPGTGFLEMAAFAMLFAAGGGILWLGADLNLWALILLALGVLPFIVAVRKSRQIIYLVVAIIAFVIGSAYIFRGAAWWQPGVNVFLALITSVLAGGYLWLAASKTLEADKLRPRHDLGALIGAVGEAKTDISSEGSVQVAGELWSAYSKVPIPIGTRVQVLKREGFTVEVEPVSE
jgi:membrane-bound serine protease (ClpP class)